MRKDDAIQALRARAEAIRALGATSHYLFGSAARNEASEASDLDLFIDYDPAGKFNGLDLVDIKLLLEAELGIEIDLMTRDSIRPMLRDDIQKSAVRVF
jgi:predicted nucleotidyltransferase